MRSGDRVDVVLDCVTEERAGRHIARVFVRQVDAPVEDGGKVPPPMFPASTRNVVQHFLGVDRSQTLVAAFAIDAGPAGDTGEAARAVLDAHLKRTIEGCVCGWAELGKSHSGHQVAMLRAAGLLV